MAQRQKSESSYSRRGSGRIPQSDAQVARPAKIILGEALEYRIARLQMFMGYFVRRGVPIYTSGMLNQATDLDLLALRYVEPFRRQMVITECKSGDVGPLDRVFWLSGVKTFVRADEAILVRKGTRWDIKDFAKRAGINVLDLHRVADLEQLYKVGPDDWPGTADRAYIESKLVNWNEQLVRNPNWWEFHLTLSTETSYDEPFAGLNYLLQQLRLITRSRALSLPGSLERKLIADGVAQVCVFLLRISELSFDLSVEDRRGFIEKGLRYGNLDPKLAERLLRSARTLTRQAILHYANRNVEIDESDFQMPLPPGSRQIVEIVESILKFYPASLNLPQLCDLTLAEVYLKGNRNGGWLKRVFAHNDLPLRLEILKKFLGLLVDAEACPAEVLSAIAWSETVSRDSRHPETESTIDLRGAPSQRLDPSADEKGSAVDQLIKEDFKLKSSEAPTSKIKAW